MSQGAAGGVDHIPPLRVSVESYLRKAERA